MSEIIIYEVDNRALVLAVDFLYRELMKRFEEEKLLPVSRALIERLSVSVPDVPIEGYYTETEELKEYFLNVRALQDLSTDDRSPILTSDAYRLLAQVMSSPIFGRPGPERFFHRRLDCLYLALQDTKPSEWSIESLTEKAHACSQNDEDFSLVAIAAYLKDSVVLAALRETVALYGMVAAGCAPNSMPTIQYVWNVDSELQAKINRFIAAFNALTSNAIREAKAENAEYFYDAYAGNHIVGRCIYIGYDDSRSPVERYHWAIRYRDGKEIVEDFWSTELWTTERYQNERL